MVMITIDYWVVLSPRMLPAGGPFFRDVPKGVARGLSGHSGSLSQRVVGVVVNVDRKPRKITMFYGKTGENHHVLWENWGKSPLLMGKL